jgi:hypothetical protein
MALLALVKPDVVKSHLGEADWMSALRGNEERLWKSLSAQGGERRRKLSENATYVLSDAIGWLAELPPNSIHAIVTAPPYSVIEYEEKDHQKLRSGRGGVWRIPPSFDGANRSPLPRFTVLSEDEITHLHSFFSAVAYGMLRALAPGGHVFIASNPLLDHDVSCFAVGRF